MHSLSFKHLLRYFVVINADFSVKVMMLDKWRLLDITIS